ncbi:NAD(P)-binding protein [Cadophora sp. DSE1049]|nr:NAD(P)-binding protein [Cadophora sp. DSE1049]
MTTYPTDKLDFSVLKGKTILITGGVTGIGRATVGLAHQHGSNLIIGYWDEVLELFQAGYEHFGAIDIILANAGVNEIGNLLKDDFGSATGKLLPPPLNTLNLNLIGILYTTKCTVHYFAKMAGKPCQLVLTGSAASFFDTPPLYAYCTSKAGVLGLMRSLRTQLPKNANITVNMVAPWMTKTPMLLPEFLDVWGDLPANESIGVARALLLPAIRTDLNGKSLFVAGHKIVDLEDGLSRTQPQWMGQELSDYVDEGQSRIIP